MNPVQGLSSDKETQLSGGLRAYYSDPIRGNAEARLGSEARTINLVGIGVVVLYFTMIALLYWDEPALRPWIAFLAVLAGITVAGIALTIRNTHDRESRGRTVVKAFGIPFLVLATLIWNVSSYGMLWGIAGAAFISIVVFLSLLWTMSGW